MDINVISWLDRISRKFPGKVVYRDAAEGQALTFAQLDRLTKSIGSGLAGRIAPGKPVAVMSGRHVLTPACYLGVVRAGCFYAPMDASMPEPRLNQILHVIHAEILVVDREHLAKAEKLAFDGQILLMEELAECPADEALLARAGRVHTELDPLYVIFTSGSTGIPKGVITSHYALMCYLDGLQEVIRLDETDVIGNQSPLDYIAAIRDIYLPLMTGAETVIIPKNEFAMGDRLFGTLNEYGVTTICWSTAGVELPAKLGAFEDTKPEHLRRVVFSGSVISSKYLRVWQQNLPEVTFINQYGPTEATGSCTYYTIDEEVLDDTVLPIGVPYKHYGICLLTDDDRAVPQGEVGEICVTGPALALGYYGQPELTAKSFIQHPLNPNYGEKLYKTGDLGRFREDGQLEFLGRKDRQVKHMGHRIELDEIELHAQQVPGVEECCALYDKPKALLWLFYTGPAASKEIILYFRKNLPAFMVPRKLQQLDELPRLPNGKKDMKALREYFGS
ncbi:MAG: amino acid adenylation domain-containing protein [Mogibacterium sp.]|nr:amino acid adenylation domain-containing protein [Mogibacterium sp.]